MACLPRAWATYLVLLSGMALRVALVTVLPSRLAYDNHFEPVEILTRDHRLPRPDECWECYQPPVYYVVSAVPYLLTERVAIAAGIAPEKAKYAARKSVQLVSVVAGCLTLVICLAVVRRLSKPQPWLEAVALGVVAFLPQHVQISAMATNDALTYLVASLAIWAALRAHAGGWSIRSAAVTGSLAGLTVLCKGYGLMTAASILIAASAAILHRWFLDHQKLERRDKLLRTHFRPGRCFAVLVVTFAAVGMWPTLRAYSLYRKTHVDNFDFFQTPMQAQPPGSTANVEWTTFRLASLISRPWIHESHVRSFWTQLYARYWFDSEGLTLSLAISKEWRSHVRSMRFVGPRRTREDWHRLLSWGEGDVPKTLGRIGVASYLAGLPLTVGVLGGAFLLLRRRAFPETLPALHLVLCLFVPVFQTFRLPFMSAMKAAFTLSALSSAPICMIAAFTVLSPRFVRTACVILIAGLAVLAAADVYFVFYVATRAA